MSAGKGSAPRKVDGAKWRERYEGIFRKGEAERSKKAEQTISKSGTANAPKN